MGCRVEVESQLAKENQWELRRDEDKGGDEEIVRGVDRRKRKDKVTRRQGDVEMRS